MKLRIATLVLPLAMACSIVSFADTTSVATTTTVTTAAATTMPLSTILQQLQTTYVCVKKIEMEHGVYEATTMNKSGEVFKLKIDPKTGAILKQHMKRKHVTMTKDMEANMPKVSIAQAAANIEKAGYTQIKEIKCACHSDYYKAEARNANGKKVDLEINKTTGVVTTS